MPGATTITSVDFATVFVTDYPAAVKFYGGILDLEQSTDYGQNPRRRVRDRQPHPAGRRRRRGRP